VKLTNLGDLLVAFFGDEDPPPGWTPYTEEKNRGLYWRVANGDEIITDRRVMGISPDGKPYWVVES
jgi:hypothetical protein